MSAETMRTRVTILRALSFCLACLSLAACSALEGPGYLWQSVEGHLDLMWRARPIAELLDDPATDAETRRKLVLVREARDFASAELALPDNGSYTRYAGLDRPFVLWNVFAAPALSVELRRWCFPLAGCVGYRGYYDKADAERFAARLAQEGYDTHVAGVPAYSTLGWFDDPMPSSVLRLSDPEIARLIFHELAHQVVYVPGDTTFNESFATAVEEAGLERWLRHREAIDGDPGPAAAWAAHRHRRQGFLELIRRTRARLAAIYDSDETDARKLAAKTAALEDMRAEYRELRRQWGGFAGYDRWFERPLGNAHLASIGAYTDLLPGFRRLLAEQGGELDAFHDAVRRLAELPADERRAALSDGEPLRATTARPADAGAPQWAAGSGHERLPDEGPAERGHRQQGEER